MIQFGIELLIFSEIIPLTNLFSQSKMKGMDQIFSLGFMAHTLSVQAINQSKKRQGSVTYSTDCENKLSKIHVMFLGFNRG